MSQELELNELAGHSPQKIGRASRARSRSIRQKYERTHLAGIFLNAYSEQTKEELDAAAVEVRIAGRIMQKRGMGKPSFAHIQDIQEKFKFMYVKIR